MPTRPSVFRARPVRSQAEYDRDRRQATDTRRLYSTTRWRALRADQLRREPLCAMCHKQGHLSAATVCDHKEPHRGNVDRFWAGPFQSLCKPCHDSAKQREEAAAARAAGAGRRA